MRDKKWNYFFLQNDVDYFKNELQQLKTIFMNTDSVIAQKTSTPKIVSEESQLIPGPDTKVKIIEAYARIIARLAYTWAWPMVNIYNRRLAFKQATQSGLMNGVLPFGPLNTISMLHDYIAPDQR